jgi:uncharacterized BrkB/YihY/UPF0761 family membrane protein
MAPYLVSAMLIVVAIIHLLPVSGVLGSERLAKLYGLPIDDPNLVILMRHRAVLFGVLGAFFILAAIIPRFQVLAFVAGFISVISFLAVAWSVGSYNAQVARVVKADIIALACLVVGVLAYLAT